MDNGQTVVLLVSILLVFMIVLAFLIPTSALTATTDLTPGALKGQGLPEEDNLYDVSESEYSTSRVPMLSYPIVRPGARTFKITHQPNTNPFRKEDGTYYDGVRYRLGLLMGGTTHYTSPVVSLTLSRLKANKQAGADVNYLKKTLNVVCGGEFQVDSETRELALLIRKTHLPQDNGTFMNYADQTSTENGPLNPCSWTFVVEFAASSSSSIDDEEAE